jgi:hypothetical protein
MDGRNTASLEKSLKTYLSILKQYTKMNGKDLDWLGTRVLSTHKRIYRPFEDAKKFVQTLNLKSQTLGQ